MNKKFIGIAMIIWGCLSGLLLIILLGFSVRVLINPNYSSSRLGNILLFVILLVSFALLSGYPLYKGISIVKKLQQNNRNESDTDELAVGKMTPEETTVENGTSIVNEKAKLYVYSGKDHVLHDRVLCRDEQYDNGVVSTFKLLTLAVLIMVLPIALAMKLSIVVNRMAQQMQAYDSALKFLSLCFIVGGAVLAISGLIYLSKNFAVGNRFQYYILDEKEGLFYSYFGFDPIMYYMKNVISFKGKLKNSSAWFYALLYIFSDKKGASARRLNQMDMYFNANREGGFWEHALMSNDLQKFASKIVGVEKIKYTPKGCAVSFFTLQDGVENKHTLNIYRSTSHYERLLQQFKVFVQEERIGDELNFEQMQVVRRNIWRRMGRFAIGMVIACVLLLGMYYMYLASLQDAAFMQDGVFQFAKLSLAKRELIQFQRGVAWAVLLTGSIFIKMLVDFIATKNFTVQNVDIKDYGAYEKNFFTWLDLNYPYFAKVAFMDGDIMIGMGKETYENRDMKKPCLVLKKGIPYCLI